MKNLFATTMFFLAVSSPIVYAADGAATAISSNKPIVLTDCSLLQDDVTLTLSTGVVGAYKCSTATNTIAVATCHSAGRSASRSIDVACVDTLSTDAEVAKTQTKCTVPGSGFNRSTSTGAAFYVGRTSGGAIGPVDLDGKKCDATNVAAKL